MLTNASKYRVLETFYALDYVFFGKPLTKVESCCPLITEEYLALKGSLMSVYIEMLKLVEHTPKTLSENMARQKNFKQRIIKTAKIARENVKVLLNTKSAKKMIRESAKKEWANDQKKSINDIVINKIHEKAFSLAVDNMLLGRIVKESKNFNKLNSWEGKIIEDSYKLLRDTLVESAIQILA